MIVFSTSGKGGSGQSVISANLAYRSALRGLHTCFVDFDFGSPTSGAIFGVDTLSSGTTSESGLHSYLLGNVSEPEFVELWAASDRTSLRDRPPGAGRLTLVPGDIARGEFVARNPAMVERCRLLFARLEEEFAVIVVDLSEGRSFCTEMSLAVTAGPGAITAPTRWLVFHRWTRQHLVAAAGLVYGVRGIADTGHRLGHDRDELLRRLGFVRTAVMAEPLLDLQAGLRSAQVAWFFQEQMELRQLAKDLDVDGEKVFGSISHEPLLQWQERLLTNHDVHVRQVANPETVQQLTDLTDRLLDDGQSRWPA